MIDVPKAAVLNLLMTLVVFPTWQITEGADGVRGRHSLIHRPQIHPAPAPSAPQPLRLSPPPSRSTPSQPSQRKIVRRPATLVSPLAEVAPITPADSTQIDPLPTTSLSDTLDNAPPEPEMIPPPEPPEPPNNEAQ